jgi:hypothetical protein
MGIMTENDQNFELSTKANRYIHSVIISKKCLNKKGFRQGTQSWFKEEITSYSENEPQPELSSST